MSDRGPQSRARQDLHAAVGLTLIGAAIGASSALLGALLEDVIGDGVVVTAFYYSFRLFFACGFAAVPALKELPDIVAAVCFFVAGAMGTFCFSFMGLLARRWVRCLGLHNLDRASHFRSGPWLDVRIPAKEVDAFGGK